MEPRDLKELHIIISGFVQGVSFRVWTKRLADRLGVNGWTRNTDEGTVEICAQGNDDALDTFLSTIKESGGPRIAEIQSIDVSQKKTDKTYTSFEIRK